MWDVPEAVTHVRTALHAAGRCRVTDLREYGEEYLIDTDLVAPRYTGAENVRHRCSAGGVVLCLRWGGVSRDGNGLGQRTVPASDLRAVSR
jgi:hypothetical protein